MIYLQDHYHFYDSEKDELIDINKNEIQNEKGIQVEINGDLFNCSVIKEPLYDPSGQKMRS